MATLGATEAPILSLRPDQMIDRLFEFKTGLTEPNLRISIYEMPRNDCEYVLGADFAYGLIGRDCDTACILKRDNGTKPFRQVAEVQGIIGERFDRLLYALHRFYNECFIVGERQVGLPILRRLYDDYGVRWMYYERDEKKRDRRMLDKLGFHQMQGADIALRNLRLAMVERRVEFCSPALIEQMSRLMFHDSTKPDDERSPDDKLKVKLTGGGSPDLVYAANYAWHGVVEVPKFIKPAKPKYAPHTYGDIFEHEALEPEERITDGAERLKW